MNSRIKTMCLYLTAIAIIGFLSPLKAQKIPVAIKASKIITVTKGILSNGMIIVHEGQIKALGQSLPIPKNSIIIDIENSVVMPGIIDAGTTIGIDRKDLTEMFDPVVPQLKIIDSFNPFGKTGVQPVHFKQAIQGGVTSAFLYPGNNINVIAGQGAVVKLAGKSLEEMIVKESAALLINLGDMPRDTYRGMKRMPSTRMGIMATLKGAFQKAQEHTKEITPSSKPPRDTKTDVIIRALNKEIPTIIHANRVDDIVAAIRFSDEFNTQLILNHCVEGYKIPELIAKKNIPVIVHNNFISPRIFEESRHFDENYADILSQHGVKIAFQSDSVVGGKILKFARINAIIYASYGMDKEEVLKGLTIYPAQLFGVSERIGSIELGKDADLIILDGDPLDVYSEVKAVLIDGQIVYRQ